jgi:hypothetical protein
MGYTTTGDSAVPQASQDIYLARLLLYSLSSEIAVNIWYFSSLFIAFYISLSLSLSLIPVPSLSRSPLLHHFLNLCYVQVRLA